MYLYPDGRNREKEIYFGTYNIYTQNGVSGHILLFSIAVDTQNTC